MYMPPEKMRLNALSITSRCADFGMKPTAPRSRALATLSVVVLGRKHDDGDSRITLAQLGEDLETVPIGQRQVEEDEVDVCILIDLSNRLTPIRSLDDRRFAFQLVENSAQRVERRSDGRRGFGLE